MSKAPSWLFTLLALTIITIPGCDTIPYSYSVNGQTEHCYLNSGLQSVCHENDRTRILASLPANPLPGYRKLEASMLPAYWAAADGLDAESYLKGTPEYALAERKSEFEAHDFVTARIPEMQRAIDDAKKNPNIYVAGSVGTDYYDFDKHVYILKIKSDFVYLIDPDTLAGVVIRNYSATAIPMTEDKARSLRERLTHSGRPQDPLLVVFYGHSKGVDRYSAIPDPEEFVTRPGRAYPSWYASAVALDVTQMDVYLPDGTFLQSVKIPTQ